MFQKYTFMVICENTAIFALRITAKCTFISKGKKRILKIVAYATH